MKALKFLIEKEFKQIIRNRMLLFLVILFPIMQVGLFPHAISFEVKDIKVDVVDHAQSQYSHRLIQKISASSKFILYDTPLSFHEAMQDLEGNKVDMVLQIPHGFDEELVREKGAQLGLSINSVNGMVGLMGGNYMHKIISDFSSELREELLNTLSPSELAGLQALPTLHISSSLLFNPHLDYKAYMVPGFMVLTLTLICGILPALNIVLEKEKGTIQQINVTPVSRYTFILSKLIPYWVIGLIIMAISVLFAYLVYGLWPTGRVVELFFSGIIFICSISGMGIIISTYSETLQQASFLVIFFILILILLSGMFTPISSMPLWAQGIAYINPFTYITRTFRMLYLNGATFADIYPNLLALLVAALLLNTWALFSYKKRD